MAISDTWRTTGNAPIVNLQRKNNTQRVMLLAKQEPPRQWWQLGKPPPLGDVCSTVRPSFTAVLPQADNSPSFGSVAKKSLLCYPI